MDIYRYLFPESIPQGQGPVTGSQFDSFRDISVLLSYESHFHILMLLGPETCGISSVFSHLLLVFAFVQLLSVEVLQ